MDIDKAGGVVVSVVGVVGYLIVRRPTSM